MELITPHTRKRYLLISVAALLILGAGTSILTWQNLEQEQKAIQKHLILSAKAIAGGIEASIGGGMHRMRMSGPMCPAPSGKSAEPHRKLRQTLKDLVSPGGLAFVQISGPRGEILVSPFKDASYTLPPNALSSLNKGTEWHSRDTVHNKPVFVYASKLDPGFARYHALKSGGEYHGPLLVLGLDMTEHIDQFKQFKANALLQTGFVLAVAVFLLLGAGTYLQRKEQEAKTNSLEKFHSSLLDTLPEGLLTLDKQGRITSANPAAIEIFNTPSRELLGLAWTELGIRDKQGEQIQDLPSHWSRNRYKEKEVEILTVPVSDTENTTLFLFSDRSELVNLEKRLEEARRFATIGRMAAGLAHEIRNPLSTLRGFSQFFASKFEKTDPAHEYAQTMVREADRLNRVVTDLLYMAGPGKISPREMDIAEAIQEVEKVIRPNIDTKSINIEYNLQEKHLEGDRDALIRILINLLLNALDAVEEEGWIEISSIGEESWIRLEIADNGEGMDEETQIQALEPFYTAKEKGTGLGLALVHRLICQHGGDIHIHSEKGKGTRITLFFPRKTNQETNNCHE